MRKIGNQLVPLFVASVVVVLPSACRDATDLAETTSQDAEMTAAEIEALEIEALWLQMPGNDREFNRLLVEELRTGVPMDWDEALRALEADGRRFPRFRVVNDDDLAPEQIAEADAAEAETLAIMEEWLRLPGNDREFNRLLVKELRTGVPMDWDEALRALEADGRRFPAMTRLTGAQLPPSVASAPDREMYGDVVRDPAYYGGERYYLDAVVALSVLRGQQRAACHGVRQARSRVAWRDDDGRERVSRYESWVGRSCLDRSS